MFVLSVPNVLTLMRLFLVPVFVVLFFTGHPIAALIAYGVASVTDFLDGYLARKLDQITSFGNLMDPLADKLMQLCMIICLCSAGIVPWWLFIALLIKELALVAGGAVLLKRKVVVRSFWPGKAATALLIGAVLCLYPWHAIAWLTTLGYVLLYAGAVMSLVAAVYYFVHYFGPGRPEADAQ